jgi:iron(III) transport system substrate-binding protein
VGSPGQKSPPVGLLSLGKYAEAPGKGLKVSPCKSISPSIGYAYPRYAALVHNTPTPNAAKLYLRYLLTEEGAGPTVNENGGFSANTAVVPTKEDPIGPRDFWQKNLLFLNPSGNARAWQLREPLSDFWRVNHE